MSRAENLLPPGARGAALLVGVVGGLSLFAGMADLARDFDPKDFGLGRNTHSFKTESEFGLASGYGTDLERVAGTAEAHAKSGLRTVLWLGASQLHAINQPRPRDRLAVAHASEAARSRGSDLRYVQLSEPNGNLHELWALLVGFLQHREPAAVVLAFTYDDLRELGVRASLRSLYELDAVDPSVLEAGDVGGRLEDSAVVETEDTPQATLERRLTSRLESTFPDFALRDRIRSYLEAQWRYVIVSAVFALRDRPQERVARERVEWNAGALTRIIDELGRRGIPLIVYKAPHRPGMQPFFHPRREYDAYHAGLDERLSAQEGAFYLDLEELVPAELWGLNAAGQPDVFHFQEAGHRRLGAAIDAFAADAGI